MITLCGLKIRDIRFIRVIRGCKIPKSINLKDVSKNLLCCR